ncbi:MAG: tetratricopeptide repeat protein [Gemmatimonadaceae bacterium]|nr:tetratricopeptide repeat protein [Gemmatimonadaceae bacterium]
MFGPAADPVLLTARAAAEAGAWGEVRAHLEPQAAASERDGARASLLAEACLRTGDPRTATRWLETAAPLLVLTGDRPGLRRVVNMQGAAAFALGTLEGAAERFGAALEMARADGDALLTARAINNLGAIDALRGDTDRAIAAYQLAIPVYHRMGQTLGLAESWHNLAISYRSQDQLHDADEAERRAIEYAGEAGSPGLAAMAQVGRAEVALRRGDFVFAHASASRAAGVFSTLPDFLLQADAIRVQAAASDRLHREADADAELARAYSLARTHAHRLQESQILQTHAEILLRRGAIAGARSRAHEALAGFEALGSTAAAREMRLFLARLA